MNMKKNTTEKILNLLISTSFPSDKNTKRKELGEKIKGDINVAYKELEKNEELSAEEIKVLKECYQEMENDSVQSLASVLSILAAFISVLSLLVSIVSLAKDLFGENVEVVCNPQMSGMLLCFIILEVLCMILVLYFSSKIQSISKENAGFRNHIVASLLLIHEKQKNDKGEDAP